MKHLSPAAYVIQTLGGVSATSRELDRARGSIQRWRLSKDRRGLDGGVPRALHARVLEIALAQGLDITPSDLVYGREIPSEKDAA